MLLLLLLMILILLLLLHLLCLLYIGSSDANLWELKKQKRNARRPQITGRNVPPSGETKQFSREV
jgi:hypothetical protein